MSSFLSIVWTHNILQSKNARGSFIQLSTSLSLSAQREGLLSEVNHGEADQADPYYAHCKLHTDRELIR